MAHAYAADADDVSPAATLARGYLAQRRELGGYEARYSELYKRLNAAVHASAGTDSNRATGKLRTPELTVTCDAADCRVELVRHVAPPDYAIENWLRGMGWVITPDRFYICPGCKERQ